MNNSIYIVYEQKYKHYIPEPEGNLFRPSFEPRFDNPSNFNSNPFTPRFDPIMPMFEPQKQEKNKDTILCVCKDLETAKGYICGFSNRYIDGPHKIV
jgi:hypothetical protein